jgi:hypothetical protein
MFPFAFVCFALFSVFLADSFGVSESPDVLCVDLAVEKAVFEASKSQRPNRREAERDGAEQKETG